MKTCGSLANYNLWSCSPRSLAKYSSNPSYVILRNSLYILRYYCMEIFIPYKTELGTRNIKTSCFVYIDTNMRIPRQTRNKHEKVETRNKHEKLENLNILLDPLSSIILHCVLAFLIILINDFSSNSIFLQINLIIYYIFPNWINIILNNFLFDYLKFFSSKTRNTKIHEILEHDTNTNTYKITIIHARC